MSLASQSARSRAPSQFSVEREPGAVRPRLRVVLSGRIRGDEVVAAFLDLYAREPDALSHDRLFDLTEYDGGFELSHLQRIAAEYRRLAGDNPPPSRTAFVTSDTGFRSWTAVMGHQFPQRAFQAFYTFEDAERFLAGD